MSKYKAGDKFIIAKVLETDEGLTICGECGAEIICNDCGDMPEVCSKCGARLDYEMYKMDVEQEG